MADLEAVRAELVRQRGFIRAAETQGTKILALLDAPPAVVEPAPVEPGGTVPPPEVVEPAPPPPDTEPAPISDAAAFVIGPQVPMGASPWPFFDANQVAKGMEHAAAFPATFDAVGGDVILNLQYYDQGLVHYNTFARTGDEQFRAAARRVVDVWYERLLYDQAKGWGTSPRNSSLGGVILRALDGRPELWPFIEGYVRGMFQMWVGARIAYPALYFGVRDGAYMTLYATWLGQVHPDEAVRADFSAKAHAAVTDYYVRLQSPDGGWYWQDEGTATRPDGVWEQPFMVGLLLEALIADHRIHGDPEVAAAIVRSVDHLWSGYRTTVVPEAAGKGVAWRAVPYFMFTDGTYSGEEHLAGATETREGWDTNTIREGRQRNSLVVHAFGYAYHLTGDPKYREWGDEIFAATYGKGEGPGADTFYGLADFRAKEYSQAYRSAGRYLAWRAD